MSELQQNRYDQLLRRVGDLKGPGSKVNDALSELFPVIDVERVPGELLILMGTDICVGAGQLLGAAGQVGRIQVFNPVGSGKIITVTTVLMTANVTTTLRMGISTTALTSGIGTETFRDTRRPAGSRPTGQMRQQSSVALAGANWQFNAISQTTVPLHDENGIAVLQPGFGLDVSPAAPAFTTVATFMWRERVAEPSELNI